MTELPYWIQIIQAVGPVVVAVAVASFTIWIALRQVAIAKQQATMAREKLKHDLYDRRYAIYLAFEKMLRVSMGQKEAGEEAQAVLEANIAAHQSLFLFDAAMRDYLLDLNDVAWRRMSKPVIQATFNDLPVEDRKRHMKRHAEDSERIRHEPDVLAAKFLPYLKLDDFRETLK